MHSNITVVNIGITKHLIKLILALQKLQYYNYLPVSETIAAQPTVVTLKLIQTASYLAIV